MKYLCGLTPVGDVSLVGMQAHQWQTIHDTHHAFCVIPILFDLKHETPFGILGLFCSLCLFVHSCVSRGFQQSYKIIELEKQPMENFLFDETIHQHKHHDNQPVISPISTIPPSNTV